MVRSSKTFVLMMAVFIVALALAAQPASATITVYANNQAGWEAAVGSFDTEYFDDATLNPGVSVSSAVGYVDTTNKLWWDRLDDDSGWTTTWTFATPMRAWAAQLWNPVVPGGPGSGIRLYADGVYVGQEIPNSYNNQFFGFVSDVGFTKVLMREGTQAGWCETLEMDNMVYGAVPEPATLLLVGIGISAVFARRRRR
jgi:hypothetical protein